MLIRKSLINLLKIPLIPVSLIVPRSNKIWIFGNKKGYTDNPRYFFEYSTSVKKTRCIWLANTKEEHDNVKSKGYESHLKYSLSGLYYSLISNVQFICNGFGDIHREISLSANIINFWHGTPIKKIYLDAYIEKNTISYIKKKITYFLSKRIFHYYASNSLEQKLVTSSLKMSKEKSSCFGSPRFDFIRSITSSNKKIILYAPTWRDNKVWHTSFSLSNKNRAKIEELLEKNNLQMIIKKHPFTSDQEIKKLGLTSGKNIHVLDSSRSQDINELYSSTTILITDISSCLFDYLTVGEKYIIFMPDLEEYTKNNRPIYNEYKEIIKNESKTTWESVIKEIETSLNTDHKPNNETLLEVANELKTKNNTCKHIYNDLTKRIVIKAGYYEKN